MVGGHELQGQGRGLLRPLRPKRERGRLQSLLLRRRRELRLQGLLEGRSSSGRASPCAGRSLTSIRFVFRRLRAGNVIFNYKYYFNTMHETEVTEDFSCPFCYVRCGSFKISEEYQVVNVILKYDAEQTEQTFLSVFTVIDPNLQLFAEKVDPRHQTFYFRHVHSHIMESGSPEDAQAASEDGYLQGDNGTSVANASIDPAQSLHGTNLSPPTVLQFGKTRKLSERADPRKYSFLRQLLQKRQFFHSHRAQVKSIFCACLCTFVAEPGHYPMALEQVYSDRDSEDEVDDDIADFEDRRMLDDFVDVTKDEKLIMHMWNSFVRKQRVLADGHIPWACEAFSQFHGQQLVENPALLWGWRFFMIKLWNHSLLDARTMDTCNTILQGFQGSK
nr:unnamed protein product [Digitaria exilis]